MKCTLRLELVARTMTSPEPHPLDARTWYVELDRILELPFPPYVGLRLQFPRAHPTPEHKELFRQAQRQSGLLVNPLLHVRAAHYDLGDETFHLIATQFQAHPSHLRNSMEQWVTGYGFEESTDHYGLAVIDAASDGDLERLLTLFNSYSDHLSLQGEAGTLALQFAARGNHLRIVELLLNMGAPLDDESTGASHALIEASGAGHLDTMRFLLTAGAKVDARTLHGSTALLLASFRGQVAAVDKLLQAGADPNQRSPRGSTPLARAAAFGHTEVVRLLLNAGASPSLADNEGETPLDIARRKGHAETVTLLEKVNRGKV